MRVLGLDIGSYSIKAVEVEIGLRNIEPLDFFEEPLPITKDLPRIEDLRIALHTLFTKHHILPPIKIVSSMPGSLVSSRLVTFPFTERSKIAQTIPFEIEEHIPFPMEKIIFDHHLLSSVEKKSNILVLFATKENIKERLDLFPSLELSPDILTADPVALYNLTFFNWTETPETFAIVNIGRNQTTISIIDNQNLSHTRTIAIGGQAVTMAIEKDYHLPFEEAEKAKIQNGFLLAGEDQSETQISPDQIRFSNCIKQAVDPLIAAIHQTFQAARSKGYGIVKKSCLTGGGSLLRNIGRYFSQELQVEVTHLKSLEAFEMSNIPASDEHNAKASLALSLALGFARKRYAEQFNFRKGEFSKTQREPMGQEIRYLLSVGGIMGLILFLNLSVNYFILKSVYKRLDGQASQMIQKFPIKVTETLLSSPTELRAFLNKKARQQEEKIEALGGKKEETLSTLEVIKQISEMVPKSVLFDVRDLSIVENHVKIKAISDSFNSIENIEKSFKSNLNFTKVVKGEISTSADGQNKDFTLTFDIKKKGKP